MMEIKFRAWDKRCNGMLYPDKDNPSWVILKHKEMFDILKLMQFTGLKDKNKKEIFIGDILKWDNQCTMVINPKNELGFYYDIITQKDKNICSFDIRFYRSEESAEIIGNIYENPKLLRRKKW